MTGLILLAVTTVLYAGYNLFIKVSGDYVPAGATTTITATICIQVAALTTSLVFMGVIAMTGNHSFPLSGKAYLWAVLAGLCIGGAEIAYLYLFGGIGMAKPMPASVVIPTVVCGTVVIAAIVSFFVFREAFGLYQVVGGVLTVAGIGLFFVGR